MDLTEKQIERNEIYDGAVLHVVKDAVRLPNGAAGVREFCLHVGAVCVLPLFSDGTVMMEKQYRYPHGRVFLEIPAGKKNSREEDSLSAAKRELREETGLIAEKMTHIGGLDTSPAITDEKIDMYLAEDLREGKTERDEDEFMTLERIPLSELYEMVLAGKIRDAKTQVAVLKVRALKEREKEENGNGTEI